MRWWIVFYGTDASDLLGGVIVTADSSEEAIDYAETNAFYPVGTQTVIPQRTSGSYPVADDTFVDTATLSGHMGTYASPFLGFTPGNGDDLNRLVVSIASSGALANGVEHDFAFTYAQSVGGGLEVDGGDDTIINVSEPGVLAVTSPRIQIAAATGRLVYVNAEIELGGFNVTFELQEPTTGLLVVNVPLALPARFTGEGETFHSTVYAETDDTGDWSASANNLVIQQVA